MFHTIRVALCVALALGTVLNVTAQENEKKKKATRKEGAAAYPPELEGSKVEVYKTVGDTKLNIYIYTPEDHKATDKRPAIVFFFGGGWSNGSPKQFEQHCKYLAARGMVAMTADYRVATRHQVKAVSCVEDAKSAVRWVRDNAKRLGIDPNKVAAGGGSAGGHLAACTGTIKDYDAKGEDSKISSVPNAMVLFNPAVVLAPIEGAEKIDNERVESLKDRMGVDPQKLSPYHHVSKGAPPAIVFHGKADTTVPYSTAEAFAQAMKKAGSRCELMGAEGQKHGYFNYGKEGNTQFIDTVKKMDAFLTSLGYLKGKENVDTFVAGIK